MTKGIKREWDFVWRHKYNKGHDNTDLNRLQKLVLGKQVIKGHILIRSVPLGLTFPWWGCYSLSLLTETSRACPLLCSLLLVSFSVCAALWAGFCSIISPDNTPFLMLFFRSYFCLFSHFNYMSLFESLPNWSQRNGAVETIRFRRKFYFHFYVKYFYCVFNLLWLTLNDLCAE